MLSEETQSLTDMGAPPIQHPRAGKIIVQETYW